MVVGWSAPFPWADERNALHPSLVSMWTAAREGKPTYEIGQAARDPQNGFDMRYLGDPRYIGWGGGIPVFHEGKVIGAIAVSGLPESEDMELAKLGSDALGE